MYVHDNDPEHRAKATQAWLEENVTEFISPDVWPAYSPDLNLIENAWAVVGEQVKRAEPKNLDQLKCSIKRARREVMTDDYRTTLVESMRRRLTAVTQANGHPTRY